MNLEKLTKTLLHALDEYITFLEEHSVSGGSYEWINKLREVTAESFLAAPEKTMDLCVAALRAIHITDRHNRSRSLKLTSAIRNVSNDVYNLLSYGTTIDLLKAWEVERVRLGRTEYGVPEIVDVKRSVTCRSCAQKIGRGQKAIEFYWDFQGCGSWTAVKCHFHFESCESIMDKVEATKIPTNDC